MIIGNWLKNSERQHWKRGAAILAICERFPHELDQKGSSGQPLGIFNFEQNSIADISQ
jgi:hypothetical protein